MTYDVYIYIYTYSTHYVGQNTTKVLKCRGNEQVYNNSCFTLRNDSSVLFCKALHGKKSIRGVQLAIHESMPGHGDQENDGIQVVAVCNGHDFFLLFEAFSWSIFFVFGLFWFIIFEMAEFRWLLKDGFYSSSSFFICGTKDLPQTL